MSRRLEVWRGVAALVALVGLVGLTSGGAIGLADPGASGERCMGCADCASGNCGGDEHPLASHHHCCATSCLSHTSCALPRVIGSSMSWLAAGLTATSGSTVLDRAPETPYRPPRV